MSDLVLLPSSPNRTESDTKYLILFGPLKNQNVIRASYHWDDRKKLQEDHFLILNLYEDYLERLTSDLNNLNDIQKTKEYWRIIIGPWLYYFISIVFDRFEMIKISSQKHKICFAELPKYNSMDWVPLDFIDFNKKFNNDDWNYYLFSEIIKNTKFVNKKETNNELDLSSEKTIRDKFFYLKSVLFFLTKIFRNIKRKVVFVEIDIPQKQIYKLLFKLRSFSISYYLRVRPNSKEFDPKKRTKLLKTVNDQNSLEKLLDLLIPKNIPLAYLEGFKEIEKNSNKIFPKKADLIMTSNAYFSNEHFKFWVAEQKNLNTEFWVMVHGGHHGTALFNGPGELTEKIADRFYCWGWGKYNLPSPKLSNLRAHNIKMKGNKILFIPYSISKYSNHVDSSPMSNSFDDCKKMHCDFFNELKKIRMIEQVIVRIKKDIESRNLEDEYSDHLNSNQFLISDNEPLVKSIEKSQLVIVTYDSTVFLEALILNQPTCLFLRKNFWEMSEDAQPFFDRFVSCGILHYDEKSLANHISKNKNNFKIWWYSKEVQEAKNSFIKKFGLNSDNWIEDWYNEINNFLQKKK